MRNIEPDTTIGLTLRNRMRNSDAGPKGQHRWRTRTEMKSTG